jgi:hypothetical protein
MKMSLSMFIYNYLVVMGDLNDTFSFVVVNIVESNISKIRFSNSGF